MGTLDLNNLLDKKTEIIKAEVGALLFNLGKTHAFIGNWRNYFSGLDENCFKNKFGYDVFKSYKTYFEEKDGVRPFDLDLESIDKKLKDFIYKLELNFDFFEEKVNLVDIIYAGAVDDKDQKKLVKVFFRGCENINSGIDKGAPKEQLDKLWISNAFGTFKEEVKKSNFDDARINFFNKLWLKLSSLDNNLDNLTHEDWIKIRRFVFSEIKEWYSHLLSDNRFPVNDVTLWDQAYMSASLFKAAVAAMCLDKNKSTDYETPKNIRWSILGIQYDKLSLVDKSLKTHFISWYRENINNCDDEVKKLIEEKYTLGNEIYRDETGIYFVVPENISGDEEDDKLYKLNDEINVVKEDIIKIFEEIFNGEIYPAILLTEPSRGTMNLAILVEKSKENFFKPCLPENFSKNILAKRDDNICDKNEKDKSYDGLCKICGLRPGKKEDDMILCDICSDRKESRMKEWVENIDYETIWTGELQDKKGRIALVTLKFEMKEWLDGDLINSLVIRNENFYNNIKNIITLLRNMDTVYKNFMNDGSLKMFENFREDNKELINKFLDLFDKGIEGPYVGICNSENLSSLKEELKRSFECFYDFLKEIFDNIDPNYKDINNKTIDNNSIDLMNRKIRINKNSKWFNNDYILVKDIFSFAYIETQIYDVLLERSIGDRWEDLINQKGIVDFENRKICWTKLTDDDIEFLSKILLQFLVRKNPSPARLRRITETTLDFLNNIKKDLTLFMFDGESKKEWRSKRIVWKTNNVKKGEYRYKGLEFMSDGEGNVYLISSIEQAVDLIKKDDVKEKEKEKEDIYKDIYNKIKSSDVDWIKDKLEHVETVDEDKTEITLENARYKNYLPYISIMDPTPTMWQFIVPAECAPQVIKEVEERYNREFKYVIGKLPMHIGVVIQDYKKPLYVGLKALRNIKRDLENYDDIKIQINAEKLKAFQKNSFHYINGYEQAEKLEDVYALYEICDDNGKYKFYTNPEKDSVWLDTTANKAESTKFCVYPNTFDFEFIDVNTRRNDIYYKSGKRLDEKDNRPYTLDKWRLFEEFFKYFSKEERKAKLQNLVSLLYSKLQDWRGEDEGLKQFMLSSFINILNLKDEEDKDKFAAIFGKKNWNDFERSSLSEFKTILKMFIDMYEFWHKALKKL
ncbi:CRISPR-associated protein Csx11 [Calorimonas adulescens]|uniref:CRISPR-associated protein Csx11 n=1 Tax=Calorimonas adulescens TaxID=2606906 RepID=A0A5D8QAJ7_9THEO|nr:CRISPR-associated protein Csx11 [Calorimonas adulescens]TZE81620.1 CRISPR-associated protein Csx11 [Calorimonas adulescens]